jgi:hypothetical protein
MFWLLQIVLLAVSYAMLSATHISGLLVSPNAYNISNPWSQISDEKG